LAPEPVPVVVVVSLAVPWVLSPEFIPPVSSAEVPPVELPSVDSDSVVVPSAPEFPLHAVVITTPANRNDAKNAVFKLRFFIIIVLVLELTQSSVIIASRILHYKPNYLHHYFTGSYKWMNRYKPLVK
jgi:hypothetical protein